MIRSIDDAITTPFALGDGPCSCVIKDSIDVAGVPTRHGSRVFADAAPAGANADVVKRLLADGGWRMVGKSTMHELAFGVTGINEWAGTPLNPSWPDLIPGGSSSGSAAAVAAHMVDMSLGTDTGGSVRMPAACCGVIGLKPSFGLVSRLGTYPALSSLDCVGPLARSVGMIERTMAAIAQGFVPQPAPDAIRLGVLSVPCDRDVADAVGDALAQSGAELSRVDLSLLAAFDAALVIIGAENWAAMGHLANRPELGSDVRQRLLAGSAHTASQIAAAEAVRVSFTCDLDRALADVDAVALPTLPIVPPTLAEAVDPLACVALTRLVRPFNLSGHPAITLPIQTVDGLPAGLQLVGRRGGDAALCAIAKVIWRRLYIEENLG